MTVMEARAGTGLAGLARKVGFGLIAIIFNSIILLILLYNTLILNFCARPVASGAPTRLAPQ
jgi:hypothetical protein